MNKDTAPTRVQRSFSADIRAEKRDDAALPVLRGHAAVFNSLSEDLGGYVERIAPGAFDGTTDALDVFALWNHNPDFVIASTNDRSLQLSIDEQGLMSAITPMDTQTIRDLVVTPIQQGKIRKMSFAFDIGEADWSVEGGRDVRNIRKVARLYDVSPVCYPAYPQTNISARTLEVLMSTLSGSQRDALVSVLTRSPEVQADQGAGRVTTSAGADLVEYWRRRIERWTRAVEREMTQEECEDAGGTWNDELCKMPEVSSKKPTT